MIFSGFILLYMKRHRKRAARGTKILKRPDESCRTSFSGHKGNKIPRISKNARNAPNFDYLNPGHINPHPRHESPKFGLFCPKNGKYHVTSYPECAPKHFPSKKTPQNTAKQTRGVTLMTPQQPVRHLDGGQICINQNPAKIGNNPFRKANPFCFPPPLHGRHRLFSAIYIRWRSSSSRKRRPRCSNTGCRSYSSPPLCCRRCL